MYTEIKSATELFEEAIVWLRASYKQYRFFAERDIVWTVQTHIIDKIEEKGLPYRILNDYPVWRGERRSLCVDLAILSLDGVLELVAEFKYEPAHKRKDIPFSKFPVVSWREGVLEDIERIKKFVCRDFAGDKTADIAYALFIDEGSHFRHWEPPQGSTWQDWHVDIILGRKVWVLLSKAVRNECG